MEIFKYDNFEFELVEPTILMVKEFAKILKEDKTKDKKKAFNIFKFMYFMYDWKSHNADLEASIMNEVLELDEVGLKLYKKELEENNKQLKDKKDHKNIFSDNRTQQCLEDCELTEKDIDNDDVLNALRRYKKIQESDLEIVLISSQKDSIHKYKKYFDQIDFGLTVESGPRKGSLVYSINDYRNSMSKSEDMFISMDKLEKRLKDKKKKEKASRRGNEEEPGLKY